MNCPQAELQLNALADHELSPWQALHVRRHVAACRACAAKLADIQRLDASAQAWQDVPAPPALGPRIAALLPPSAAFLTSRRTFPIRPAAVGLVGVAAAVAAFFWFLPGQPGQPTIAFADVQKAMQQVQIMSVTTYMQPPHAADHGFQPIIANTDWVRRNPPAVMHLHVGRFKPNVVVAILKDKRGYFTRTAQGKYHMVLGGKRWMRELTEEVGESLEYFTEQPIPQSSKNAYGYSYNTVIKSQQQIVTLRGRKCVLFTYRNDMFFRKGDQLMPKSYNHSRGSVWVDPMTRLVVRMETDYWQDKHTEGPQWSQRVVNDNFLYNQAPPPGVFDWSPPPGANVIDMNALRTDKRLRLYLPKKRAKA